MNGDNLVIGVDYGTDSVRSIIVDTQNGQEISSSVYYYQRWGKKSPPVNGAYFHP